MDLSLTRENLEQLLAVEAKALAQLDELLDQEHRMITADNIEGLEQTGAAREICITDLLKIDAERLSLCRLAGLSADHVGLNQLLNWCDPQGTLQTRWEQSVATISHCRSLNERNGALVNTRLKRVEGLLDTLNGPQVRNERVYTARGNAYQQRVTGRVCDIQA